MPNPAQRRAPAVLACEATALCGFALLLGECLRRLVSVAEITSLPLLVAGLLAGHALADLVTGIAHWLCDRVFDERAPLLGPLLVKPFRDHHDDPLGITRNGFLGVNGNTALSALPVLAAALALPSPEGPLASTAWACFLGLAFSAVATNQLHAWAHAPRVPRGVAWLQAHGWVLAPRAHARHHRGTHDRAYCVTTGWWNPLLDRAQVFTRLEALLSPRGRGAATP